MQVHIPITRYLGDRVRIYLLNSYREVGAASPQIRHAGEMVHTILSVSEACVFLRSDKTASQGGESFGDVR